MSITEQESCPATLTLLRYLQSLILQSAVCSEAGVSRATQLRKNGVGKWRFLSVYFFMVASVFVVWSSRVYFKLEWIFYFTSLVKQIKQVRGKYKRKGQIQSWVKLGQHRQPCDHQVQLHRITEMFWLEETSDMSSNLPALGRDSSQLD